MTARFVLPWVLLGLLTSACGGGSKTPAAPSPPPPVNLSGIWSLTTTLGTVTSNDCIGALFAPLIGTTSESTVSIQHSGTIVTGTDTENDTGASCRFSGTFDGTNYVANIDPSSCSIIGLNNVMCPSGVRRDIRLVSSASSGIYSNEMLTGTASETHTIFISGTNLTAGSLILQGTIRMIRR